MKQRLVAVQLLAYRSYRLEVLDEVGAGWRVLIHPPPDCGAAREVLRTEHPDGLVLLLAEARDRVEQLLAKEALRLSSG